MYTEEGRVTSEALRTSGLTRSFGARVAISALNLTVREGDCYGFLGPNGSGKTTAIRCILGLIRRDQGEVRVFGEADPIRQRRHVGALVETPAFHAWMSARENLALAAAYAGIADPGAAVARALEQVGLQDRGTDQVSAYSLGMRQRLGIARALLGGPRLLILDEPTNGLDPRGMKEIRDLLRGLAGRERLTVFVSSHLLAEVSQLCNRVGILERGRLVYEGDVAGLPQEEQGPRLITVDVGAKPGVELRGALEAIDGVTVLGPGEAGRLRARLDGLDAAALNARLVRAGVPVEALVPVEGSLEDLYLAKTTREIT